MKIQDLEGVGPEYAARLQAAGVQTTDDLLVAAGPVKGRDGLATATGISPKLILEWVNHVDLYRIKGVGSEYADLLEQCGVDSCTELAQRNPANLAATMAEANAVRSFVRRVPTEDVLADWIAQAKVLPKVVSH